MATMMRCKLDHVIEYTPRRICPVCSYPAIVITDEDACWECGTVPTAVADHCGTCGMRQPAPVLSITFADGKVSIWPGEDVVLGRDPAVSPSHKLFAGHFNVHRHHAILLAQPDGRVIIVPIPSAVNGVFVNDEEIISSTELHPGDRIRLATATGIVITHSADASGTHPPG